MLNLVKFINIEIIINIKCLDLSIYLNVWYTSVFNSLPIIMFLSEQFDISKDHKHI